jgi:hypothetical protein
MLSQKRLIESGVVGIFSYIIGSILMTFFKPRDPKTNKVKITFNDKLVMFLIGAIAHLILKTAKLDQWYCNKISIKNLTKV